MVASQAQASLQEGLLAFVNERETVEVIQTFAERTNTPIVGVQKGSIEQAAKYLGDKPSPSYLVVDAARSNDIVQAVLELAEVCDPGVSVVVLGRNADIDLYRELLNLGVKDYIVKPVAVENLYEAFDERASEQKVSKVVGFIGASGGCGATTLTSCAAWMLAEESKRFTALVDFDFAFSAMSHVLNREPQKNISDAFQHPERVDRLFMERSMDAVSERLALLSGRLALEKYAGQPARRYGELLRRLGARFRYVITEVPRWNGSACRALGDLANIIVLVYRPDILSVRNAVEILHGLSASGGARARILIVANCVGAYRKGEITRQQFEQVSGHVVDHMVRFDVSALEGLNRGAAFMQGGGIFQNGVRVLAKDISGKRSVTAGGGARSFLSRLLSPAPAAAVAAPPPRR